MKKIIYTCVIGALSLSLLSCGKKTETDNKEVAKEQNDQKFKDSEVKKDVDFVVNTADASMFEVMLGQVAASNAVSNEVKQLGQTMVNEHTKANDELKALALQKNITLPVGLSDKKQKKYEEISGKKGKDFDKAYVDAMVEGHKDVIDSFKKEAEKGEDAEVKGWAGGKISTLEHHLMMSQQAEEVLKNQKK